MPLPTLKTKRLILRNWKKSDLLPFFQLNADSRVMEFYAKTLSRKESDALAEQIQRNATKYPYGFWAVEVPGISSFIGYIGLNYWDLQMDFSPCVDIGWRIAFPYWGFGYALEGAQEVLRYGFENIELDEIVSMATIGNFRSQRLMKRLAMEHDPKENFHHPKLLKRDPLSMRVLYRLSKQNWFSHNKTL